MSNHFLDRCLTRRNKPDRRSRLRASLAATSLAALTAQAPACGPFFPNQVIVDGDRRALGMPAGCLADEMERLRPAGEPPFKAVMPKPRNDREIATVYSQSVDVDVADVDAALAAAQSPDDLRKALVKQYRAVRERIAEHARSAADDAERGAPGQTKPMDELVSVPDGIPTEFSTYLHGLILFHQGHVADARTTWEQLLEQPAGQRSHRGAWAAFMLGKSCLTDDPKQSADWFAKTRAMLQDQPDPLGLASGSLGWEARADLNAGQCGAAIDLYMRQYWTGDPSAVESLGMAAKAAFAGGPDRLAALAKDPVARRVLTAYVVADGRRYSGGLSDKEKKLLPIWLNAVDTAAVTDISGADRLAWAAYSTGEFKAAQRWVDRAPKDSAVAQWVRAKLLLRAGKSEESAKVLATIVRSFPESTDMTSGNDTDGVDRPDEEHLNIPRQVASELAVLNLARGQYTDSLKLLMRADRWQDAAYVAERVLTVDELKQYVDQRVPESTPEQTAVARIDSEKHNLQTAAVQSAAGQLRHLLARRLTRAGRWKEAREYYPAALRPKLDEYITDVRDGHDAKRPKADRAKSFVAAAKIAHDSGMELLGTELDPDFFCYGGDFGTDGPDKPRGEGDKAVGPSADELKRFAASAPDDDRRFHYRYVAIEHAWEAALLMPDDTDDLAKLLNEAGGWVKAKDPKAADKFYKALVRRCPSTDLGKQAAALHWFPPDAAKK